MACVNQNELHQLCFWDMNVSKRFLPVTLRNLQIEPSAQLCLCTEKRDYGLNYWLALLVVVALVLVWEQRLAALHLVWLCSHGTRRGGKNNRNQHEGRYYPHCDDFGHCESLSWKCKEEDYYYRSVDYLKKAEPKKSSSPGHSASYEYPRFSGAVRNISAFVTGGQKGTML